jgi:hypothetical protein
VGGVVNFNSDRHQHSDDIKKKQYLHAIIASRAFFVHQQAREFCALGHEEIQPSSYMHPTMFIDFALLPARHAVVFETFELN